ncbi:MAG: sulfurtransferase [Terriglobales bacterium]
MERRPVASRRLLILLFLTLLAPAQTLVSARWLREHLNQVTVIAAASPAVYQNGHIPGAQLPGRKTAGNRRRAVVYQYASWPIAATRVFARLDARGLGQRAAILNGGWRAWLAAGGHVETGRSGLPAALPPPRVPGNVFVARSFVAAHLHDVRVQLIDARLPAFYSGQQAELPGERLGHIPGAINVPFDRLATRDGYFLSRKQLAAAFRRAGVRHSNLLVIYCHSGRKAAVDYFVARLLGYRARYYAGSWLNWTVPPARVEPR